MYPYRLFILYICHNKYIFVTTRHFKETVIPKAINFQHFYSSKKIPAKHIFFFGKKSNKKNKQITAPKSVQGGFCHFQQQRFLHKASSRLGKGLEKTIYCDKVSVLRAATDILQEKKKVGINRIHTNNLCLTSDSMFYCSHSDQVGTGQSSEACPCHQWEMLDETQPHLPSEGELTPCSM